jgi:hypothetical protein
MFCSPHEEELKLSSSWAAEQVAGTHVPPHFVEVLVLAGTHWNNVLNNVPLEFRGRSRLGFCSPPCSLLLRRLIREPLQLFQACLGQLECAAMFANQIFLHQGLGRPTYLHPIRFVRTHVPTESPSQLVL